MRLNEQQILELRCTLEKLITRREGMIAENKQREFAEQAMAYNDEHFLRVEHQIQDLENHISYLGEK